MLYSYYVQHMIRGYQKSYGSQSDVHLLGIRDSDHVVKKPFDLFILCEYHDIVT